MKSMLDQFDALTFNFMLNLKLINLKRIDILSLSNSKFRKIFPLEKGEKVENSIGTQKRCLTYRTIRRIYN